MWELVNHTQFPAERTFARARDGAEVLIVAVRATFRVAPDGSTEPDAQQQPVVVAPRFVREPGISSLLYDCDLVLAKPCTDVLVHAEAFAPGGRAVARVEVSVCVGPVVKRLWIHGRRTWQRGALRLVPGDPEPFVRAPIDYEHAFGGALFDPDARYTGTSHPENPIGCGLRPRAGDLVPSVGPPEELVASRTIGLGPIAHGWAPRRQFAGTYDVAWECERQPLVPLDFCDDYFCAAPLDQRVSGGLRGGEEVELVNLDPEGRSTFRIPRLALGLCTFFADDVVYHRPQLDTVILEPSDRRLVLVYRSSLPCHYRIYQLHETHVYEKDERRLASQFARNEPAA